MNKLRFYNKLAYTNLTKNRQLYLPFLLTASFCSAMFYIMRYLSTCETITSISHAVYVTFMLDLGSIIIGVTMFCILWYANKFVMKRRQRELGLYHILGMNKSQITRVLCLETLILLLFSYAAGVGIGLLFSKLMLLALLQLLHFDIPMGFSVSPSALWEAAVLMTVLFVILLLYNLIGIRRTRPIDLLKSVSAGEKEPKSRWFLAILGILALGGGYAIALLIQNPIDALMLFFVAVLLVIIGTFCLFTAGSVVILKALRRNKKFYYRPKHFTAVSGLIYRMGQNAKGLSNICILSTMVIIAVACSACFYNGTEDMARNIYPESIFAQTVIPPEKLETADLTALDDIAKEAALPYGVKKSEFSSHLRLSFAVSGKDGRYETTNNNFSGQEKATILEFILLEDYNRLTGEAVRLNKNEVLACGIPAEQTALSVNGSSFTVKKLLDEMPVRCSGFSTALSSVRYFVVSDRAVLRALYDLQLKGYGQKNASALVYNVVINPALPDETIISCAETVDKALHKTVSESDWGFTYLSTDCRQVQISEFFASYGGLLFLGLFLGVLFMLATVLIIYYKQISEGYEDRDRFVIMQKVGMSEHEVRGTIRQQVLMVFFLPLLLAAVHVAVSFPMILKLFQLFSMTNVALFALCTVASFLLFTAVYILVYSTTARRYYKIVRA